MTWEWGGGDEIMGGTSGMGVSKTIIGKGSIRVVGDLVIRNGKPLHETPHPGEKICLFWILFSL